MIARYLPISLATVTLALTLILAACGPATSPAPSASVPPNPDPTDTPTADALSVPDSAGDTGGFRTFVIDPEQSTASYIMDEEFFGGALAKYGIASGKQDTVGSTQAIEGVFEINPDDLSNPLRSASFTVDLTQLASDQGLRDRWLRNNGPQFNSYPTAEFVATSIENGPESYAEGSEVQFQLVGDMTIREISHSVAFEVTATLADGVISGSATAPMKLTDYDIEPPDFANTLTVKDDFEVRIDFVAIKQ